MNAKNGFKPLWEQPAAKILDGANSPESSYVEKVQKPARP